MFFAARTASVKKEVISFWDITSYPCFLPEKLFHTSANDVQQLIRNRLLAALVVLLRQVLTQLIGIVRGSLRQMCIRDRACMASIRAACSEVFESKRTV